MDIPKQGDREWGDKSDLGRRYDVTERTVNDWMRKGCPHVKPSPKIVRFNLKSVDAWLVDKFGVRRR